MLLCRPPEVQANKAGQKAQASVCGVRQCCVQADPKLLHTLARTTHTPDGA
jgi:hypothetical protein